MTGNPRDQSSGLGNGAARMLALCERLEDDLAESICRTSPGTPGWRPFAHLLSDKVDRALADFPDVVQTSLGLLAAQVSHSPIDDALREVQAIFGEALERQGFPREATRLLSEWIEYRVGIATFQFRITALRERLGAEAPTSAD